MDKYSFLKTFCITFLHVTLWPKPNQFLLRRRKLKASTRDNTRQLKLEPRQLKLEPRYHRRILSFLNVANYPEDLTYEKMTITQGEGSSIHNDNLKEMNPKRKKILDIETAEEILEFRDREYPLGFRNLNELFTVRRFHRNILEILLKYFSHVNFGRWVAFPVPIPRRGPGGIDGVVHAALLHTGKVLFITADETTLLWDPENTTPATFEDPVNQPHQTPDAESGYSVRMWWAFLSVRWTAHSCWRRRIWTS